MIENNTIGIQQTTKKIKKQKDQPKDQQQVQQEQQVQQVQQQEQQQQEQQFEAGQPRQPRKQRKPRTPYKQIIIPLPQDITVVPMELRQSYSLDQYRQYMAVIDDLQKRKVKKQQCKALLKLNTQVKPDNKKQLYEKIAECTVLGCIPYCQYCKKGRPSFYPNNEYRLRYKCYGFYDEITKLKVVCNRTFWHDQIERTPWNNNEV